MTPSYPRWEYRTIERPHVVRLNQLGEEGWELVAVTAWADSSSSSHEMAYLKRPVYSLIPEATPLLPPS